jgi:shikimate dehydrogenase
VTAERTRCAVLGSPIAHSRSPQLHRAAYAALGLDWTYERFEVTEAELADFVAGLDDSWRGLSLTMPLKTAVLALGEPDPRVRLVGAANTLVFHDEERRVYNTDVGGLVAAVRRAWTRPVQRVTILGSGATARSAIVSAAELGASEIAVVARTPSRIEPLIELGRTAGTTVSAYQWPLTVPESDLLISTVTAGAADAVAEAAIASAPVIFDAIYDPWPTVLAAQAEDAGRTVVSGLDLLVEQAGLQIELMTGRTVPVELLYAALQRA